MKEMISSPIFGVFLTLLAYEIGLYIQKRTGLALANPLLISIVLIMTFLHFTGVSYGSYEEGGKLISFFIAPATVVLAVPLYKNFQLLKENAFPILVGIFTGTVVNVLSLVMIFKVFKLDLELLFSLIPKSVTTPIGVELSAELGGIPQITIAAIIISGVTGVIFGPIIFKLFKIDDPVAKGVAFGTAAHALGTARALEEGEIEGGMSGLSIGLAGVITVLLAPLLLNLLL